LLTAQNKEKITMMSVIDLLSSSPAAFITTCLVFGLLIGSFLNVVIYRVPVILDRQWRAECRELCHETADSEPAGAAATGEPSAVAEAEPRFNLVVPRSACPSCKAPITALQNIPVLSYVILKGRCASCGVRISPRYPAIEALTGILSAAVAWKFGFGWPALSALVLTWFLIALTFIDIDHHLLPDELTLPLVWIGLMLTLWAPASVGIPIPVGPRESIIGAIAGYLSLWSVYHLFLLLTGEEGMGYGDFKLLAALGAWLGYTMLLPILLVSAVVGAVLGGTMLLVRGQGRRTHIAYGPYIAAAGWVMLMFGHELVSRYWGFVSPRP
jgi:leader peptidase (prepilin peptidase)/N-methyltransferase